MKDPSRFTYQSICVCVYILCRHTQVQTSAGFLLLVAEFSGLQFRGLQWWDGFCYKLAGPLMMWLTELVCQSAEPDQWFLSTFIQSNKWSARQTMAIDQGNQLNARGNGVNMFVQSPFCSQQIFSSHASDYVYELICHQIWLLMLPGVWTIIFPLVLSLTRLSIWISCYETHSIMFKIEFRIWTVLWIHSWTVKSELCMEDIEVFSYFNMRAHLM